MSKLSTLAVVAFVGSTIACSVATQAGFDHPNAISASQSLAQFPPQTVTPAGTVVTIDPGELARSAEEVEKEHISLLVGGMEPGRTGWHVVLPEQFCLSTDGSLFPSIYNYTTATGWHFLAVPGSGGSDYYPPGVVRNGGGTANLPKEAGMAFSRSFPNALARFEIVAEPGGAYGVRAVFSPRSLKSFEAMFGPKSTTPTGYVDWFGVGRGTAESPTQARVAVVSNGRVYEIVDMDGLLVEHRSNLQATLSRAVAEGLSLTEAQAIANGV